MSNKNCYLLDQFAENSRKRQKSLFIISPVYTTRITQPVFPRVPKSITKIVTVNTFKSSLRFARSSKIKSKSIFAHGQNLDSPSRRFFTFPSGSQRFPSVSAPYKALARRRVLHIILHILQEFNWRLFFKECAHDCSRRRAAGGKLRRCETRGERERTRARLIIHSPRALSFSLSLSRCTGRRGRRVELAARRN